MTLVVVIARERSDRGNLFNRQPCPITNYSTQTVVVEAGPRLAQGLTAEAGGLETRPYAAYRSLPPVIPAKAGISSPTSESSRGRITPGSTFARDISQAFRTDAIEPASKETSKLRGLWPATAS